MDNFTWIDGAAALVILLSAILAYSRGFVREAMAIIGWVGAAIVAYVLAPPVVPLVREVPVVGDFLADSCELSVIAAFAAVFAAGLIVAALFTPLLSSIIGRSILGGIDQVLGFLFGVARGVLLIAVALIVYDRAMGRQSIPMIDASRTAEIFASFQESIDAAIPTGVPEWIVERYNGLTAICASAGETPPAGAQSLPEAGQPIDDGTAPAP